MKQSLSIVLLITVGALLSACGTQERKTELKTQDEKISYALGLDIGGSLSELNTELDIVTLIQAIRDTLTGGDVLLTGKEIAEVMQEFSKQMATKQNQEAQAQQNENLTEGEMFMEENKNKEGVQTTASGLQYKVLTEGDGAKPSGADRVTVHYRGTLLDGTEFDSSYKRGQPATFALNGVIKGWTEGLQLMKMGSKYEFVIPPELAYGKRGTGGQIGPDATLIFEVELLDIAK